MIPGCERRVRADESRPGGNQQHHACGCGKAREDSCRALDPRGNRALQRLEYRIEIPRTVVAQSVDEHAGRPRHSDTPAVGDILVHAPLCFLRFQVTAKALHIETEFGCELEDILLFERRLLFVDVIVHLPKLALFVCGLRCAREKFGAWMRAFIWEMSKDVNEPATQRLTQFGEDIPKPAAVRAEIIPIEDQRRDAGRRAPAAVMVAADIDRARKRDRSA